MRKRKLFSFLVLFFLLLPGRYVAATTPIKIEALGFFTHMPMRHTRTTIQTICEDFGDQVELVLYDESSSEGIKFMEERGLQGHLPMVLYVNGSIAHEIDGRLVVFRDFADYGWNGEDLRQVISLYLDGVETAVAAPPNATTEAWDPGGIPQAAANYESSYYPREETRNNSSNMLIYLLYGMILILAGAIFMIWRRTARGK